MWNVMFVYNVSKLPNHILNFTFIGSGISKKRVSYVSLKRVTSFSKQANTAKWLLWCYMSLILLTWIEFSIKDPISRECSLHRSTRVTVTMTLLILFTFKTCLEYDILHYLLHSSLNSYIVYLFLHVITIKYSYVSKFFIFCLKIFNFYI